MIHYPQDRTVKLVIRFVAGPLFSRGYLLKFPRMTKREFTVQGPVADLDITKGWFPKSQRARRVSIQSRRARTILGYAHLRFNLPPFPAKWVPWPIV